MITFQTSKILLFIFTSSLALNSMAISAKSRIDLDCIWSNNIDLDDNPVLYSNNSKFILSRNKPLAVNAPECGNKKRICFGQVTCLAEINKSKKNSTKFDFYTYASCVSKDNGKCPSPNNCIQQKGKLQQFSDLEKKQGYLIYEERPNKWIQRKTEKSKSVQ